MGGCGVAFAVCRARQKASGGCGGLAVRPALSCEYREVIEEEDGEVEGV